MSKKYYKWATDYDLENGHPLPSSAERVTKSKGMAKLYPVTEYELVPTGRTMLYDKVKKKWIMYRVTETGTEKEIL